MEVIGCDAALENNIVELQNEENENVIGGGATSTPNGVRTFEGFSNTGNSAGMSTFLDNYIPEDSREISRIINDVDDNTVGDTAYNAPVTEQSNTDEPSSNVVVTATPRMSWGAERPQVALVDKYRPLEDSDSLSTITSQDIGLSWIGPEFSTLQYEGTGEESTTPWGLILKELRHLNQTAKIKTVAILKKFREYSVDYRDPEEFFLARADMLTQLNDLDSEYDELHERAKILANTGGNMPGVHLKIEIKDAKRIVNK